MRPVSGPSAIGWAVPFPTSICLAVVARREEAVLVTSNTRHFRGLGIELEDWMVPIGSR